MGAATFAGRLPVHKGRHQRCDHALLLRSSTNRCPTPCGPAGTGGPQRTASDPAPSTAASPADPEAIRKSIDEQAFAPTPTNRRRPPTDGACPWFLSVLRCRFNGILAGPSRHGVVSPTRRSVRTAVRLPTSPSTSSRACESTRPRTGGARFGRCGRSPACSAAILR